MEGRFTGVSLGAQVAGNVTWALDMDVTFGSEGITVLGRDDAQANTVPWSAVLGFSPGFTLTFPDGRPATELEALLADRRLTFLVPADQLPPGDVAELIALAPAKAAVPPAAAGPPAAATPPATQTQAPRAQPERREANTAYTPIGYTAPPPATQPYVPPRVATGSHPYAGGVAVGGRTKSKRSGKRSPILIGASAVILVIAIVAAVLVVGHGSGNKNKPAADANVTRTTKPPVSTTTTTSPVPAHELPGPPASMSPVRAISDVVVQGSYLKGWDSIESFGQLVAGQQEVEFQGQDENPFFAGESANFEPAFELLQQCTNLPLDHLQLLTQNYYAGGPPTWETAIFYPHGANPYASTPTPQLYSEASVVATPAVQESDMAAYAASSFTSCFTSFMTQYLRAALSQNGENVDSLTIERLPVASYPGVETVEVELNAQQIIQGSVYPVRQRLVFMGAGRLEQQMVGFDSPTDQIPLTTWDALIHRLQYQMASTAKL